MPLSIAVVGAGISGLTAAVALRKAGHNVRIYESSSFSGEVGAAVNLTPNGVKVLESLGFDFKRARGTRMLNWDVVNGETLTELSCQDLGSISEKLGAPYYAVHRNDLHQELMRLANAVERPSKEVYNGAEDGVLYLASRVTSVDASTGTLTFTDGSTETADVIVGADGVYSVVRTAVLENPSEYLYATGRSAFRFLLTTEELQATEVGRQMLEWKKPGVTVFLDTNAGDDDRHLIWYPCRDGMVQNLVGIHMSKNHPESDTDYRDQLLKEFSNFNPKLVEVISVAKEAKNWPLFAMKPIPAMSSNRVVLIGDAAHAMLPFGGQGSNQAFEDGGVLGLVLSDVHDAAAVPSALKRFSDVRLKRVSRVQTISSYHANSESRARDAMMPYMEPGVDMPDSFAARVIHDAGYDAMGEAKRKLAGM